MRKTKSCLWFGLMLWGVAACGNSAPSSSGSASPAAVGAGNAAVTTSVSTANLSASLSTEELKFFNQLNALRIQNGVAPLILHSALEQSAREHSAYMADAGSLTHDEPSPNLTSGDRIENAGGNFDFSAENIAWGNTTANATYAQWVSSPSHLENMLSANYQYIGISENDAYWTTDFGGN